MKHIQNNSNLNSKVTLVCCVHGNELFGKTVFYYFLRKIEQYPGLSLVLANEPAIKARKRYVDADLNRSFPGNTNSKLYEPRLAAKLLDTINPKSVIIDIHTTKTRLKAINIVTSLNSTTKSLLSTIPYPEVAYMGQGFGSLISQYERAVSLEYNRDYAKRATVLKTLDRVVKSLLHNKNGRYTDKTIYECAGKLPLSVKIPINPKDFYYISERESYVLFPRNRAVKGFKGFEMKKIN